MSKTLKILFLGASKRVSLLERFIETSKLEKIDLEIFSCELKDDFYPISKYATILPGPKFDSQEFLTWLDHTIAKYNINIVIPNMDSATVALSKFKDHTDAFCAVSKYELCLACEDKSLSLSLFKKHNLPFITNTLDHFPKIIKSRHGFGGKGIYKISNQTELNLFEQKHKIDQFVIEDFIHGLETTTDLFIDKNNQLIGYVLRDRLEVSDGEVMVCNTRPATPKEAALFQKIAAIPGWYGCITVQTIQDLNNSDSFFLMEINPRFGGGCTAAIEAGLNMPQYILNDYGNIPNYKPKKLKNIRMTRARQDFFCEISYE